MKQQGRPVVTNFNIDLSYTVDWTAVSAALATQPAFIFQNNGGFSHVLSEGSYSWIMPTTTDYGMSYLTSFYDTGIPLTSEETFGAAYKGFNDSLASWGSNRVMGQQCGQTWLQTFSNINGLYNSGKQLSALQLVTWNDYEEGSEIESGISNCLTISASVAGNALSWKIKGASSTVDHYVPYISIDGQNLMALASLNAGTNTLNLCSYSIPNGTYVLYVQAVGRPTITNAISGSVKFTAACNSSGGSTEPTLTFGANPSAMTVAAGGSGKITVTATPQSGTFDSAIALTCSGLPKTLSCSFAPASVTPGNGAAQSVLTISAAAASARNNGGRRDPILATWMLGFGLLGVTVVGKARRKRLFAGLGTCALAAMIIASISCGGQASSSAAEPSGSASSYPVTINGSSGSVQVSTTVTVTVQ